MSEQEPTGESTTESILIYIPDSRVIYTTPVPAVNVPRNAADIYTLPGVS